MADEILTYYERELSFLRQTGAEFAASYPKIASRLLLEADKCEDPHVERLIQAFAFLAARIRYKLDDDFPEITDSLLSVLYPHYLAPVPSMAIVQFVLDAERGKLTEPFRIARGAKLFSPPVSGAPCRFRTAYPVTLWPLTVTSARLGAADGLGASKRAVSVIRLGLRAQGGTSIAGLRPEALRFFLHGEGHQTWPLYELLCNNVREVHLRPGAGRPAPPIRLGPECIRPVGFAADEGLLPYGPRSFLGYRLLHEYFAFPEKFLFVDVTGLDAAAKAGFGEELEILIFLDHIAAAGRPSSQPSTFRLGCTPVVNLFEQIAEPIRVSQTDSEYRVVLDGRRQDATEVYSVDSVVSVSPDDPQPLVYRPFYSFKHEMDQDQQRTFWYATRRASDRKGDAGTEVYLSLVDLDFKPSRPPAETLTVHVTCTNRDLPARLPFGGERGVLELEGAAPLSRILCLTKPTTVARPPHGPGRPVAPDLPPLPELPVDLRRRPRGPAGDPATVRLLGLPGRAAADRGHPRRHEPPGGGPSGLDALERLLPRPRGDRRSRRGAVRRHRSLPVRVGARAVLRALLVPQLVHPARRADPSAQRAPQAMASESRRTDPSVEELLFDEGFRFEFFQAVRLLERVFPERGPVGRDVRPGEEIVRFRAHNSLTFPPSSIHDLSRTDGEGPASMMVAFMGLTGPSGVLPRHYTEMVLEEERRREHGLAGFFDVFNHRMVSLFYRAWQKYRVPIAHEQASRPGRRRTRSPNRCTPTSAWRRGGSGVGSGSRIMASSSTPGCWPSSPAPRARSRG